MGFTLLTGGVASGKSRLACDLAATWDGPVVMIVTGEPRDEEMRARIAKHRDERPAEWEVREVPLALATVTTALPDEACVVLDCLTLWVSNQMGAEAEEGAVLREARLVASALAARRSPAVVITNEVGAGIVPMHPVARAYRDLLGRVNRAFSSSATQASLVVAGRVLPLAEARSLELP
jgi:adenosylcobinamide kinase/adenosylcobinamide-phosphate guanylyltransferase